MKKRQKKNEPHGHFNSILAGVVPPPEPRSRKLPRIHKSVIYCERCQEAGHNCPATVLAPQTSDGQTPDRWQPLCDVCYAGWWNGSDDIIEAYDLSGAKPRPMDAAELELVLR